MNKFEYFDKQSLYRKFVIILLVIAIVAIFILVLMLSFDYSIPRFKKSLEPSYDIETYVSPGYFSFVLLTFIASILASRF